MQDYDVDLEYMPLSDDLGRRPWDAALLSFIQLARIQSQAYETLFSPAADKRTPRDRHVTVEALTKRLENWRESWSQLETAQATRKELFDVVFGGLVDVVYYSTLALVHRALSPPKSPDMIIEPCFEYARQSLQAATSLHSRYMEASAESLTFFTTW